MQLIAACDGQIRALPPGARRGGGRGGLSTGLAALDELSPGGALESGVIHEVLSDDRRHVPRFFALLLARAAAVGGGAVVWCDPGEDVYPPALAAGGLPLERLFLLRARRPTEQLWAAAECLRCKGVAATVAAPPPRLSRVEARRLQLAAERGGGIGVLLRQAGASSAHYAAATRWLVKPVPGNGAAQRWDVQLIHGHGGRVGKTITLEVCRDTNLVRAVDVLAGRPDQAKTARASA